MTAPTRAAFRDRCLRADARAYNRFELPHLAGGVPAEDDEEEEDEEAEDTAETERLSLAAYPPPYVHNWSKLNGVKGKLPEPSITHDGQPVADVFKIDYQVPSDAFHQVANSGLLNTPQLGSLYSSVGTRVHLVLGFTPLLKETGELDDGETLYVQLRHVRAGDKGSPYDVQDGRVALKPVFREWVFERFYAKFVQHVFEAMEGVPWLVEYPVYHPHLLVGHSGALRCPQTFLDAIYRMPDGSLTLVDWKSLMQARPPNYRLRDLKNLRQIVTNAAYFQAMTKIRLQRASLVYITRMGTLTVLTLDLAACGAVTKAALLQPLSKPTHFITYTADRLVINKQLHIQVLDELGAATGQEAGVPIPAELKPPAEAVATAQPQQAAQPAAAEEEVPPPRQRRRSRRRRSSSASDGEAVVGALYEAGEAGAAAAAGVSDGDVISPPAQQGTLEERRDLNHRIGDSCEALFDDLPKSSKSRLRGRAQELFTFLAASPALFPPLATADGAVVPTPPARLAPADARPLAIQALIRTAQRALNQAVARRFLRTRGALARAEVAEGVVLGEFLAEVAHHAARPLWSAAAVEWAEAHVGNVLQALEEELARFLEVA